jgi:hypothetical protein
LHKVYEPVGQQWVVIFGGSKERPIECYDMETNKIGLYDALEGII